MDLSFFRSDLPGHASHSVRLDHDVLVASLRAMQEASAAARALRGSAFASTASARHPIVELVLGGPGWREAAAVQGGCFHRSQAQIGRGDA